MASKLSDAFNRKPPKVPEAVRSEKRQAPAKRAATPAAKFEGRRVPRVCKDEQGRTSWGARGEAHFSSAA